MGIHLRSALAGVLAVVLPTAPVIATTCLVCCDPAVAHGVHASVVTPSSHGSPAAEPSPATQKPGDEGETHCTQSDDRADADRSHSESPDAARRIAPQDRACPVPAVAPATARTAGRSDVQDTTPSLAAPVRMTWHAAWQLSTAGVTPRSLFPPPSRSRTPLNLRI